MTEKIIGIMTCGTFPSWVDYALGSIYNVVDKIIVINSGYDLDCPEKGPKFPEPVNNDRIKEVMEIDENISKDIGRERKIKLFEGVNHDKLLDKFKIDYGKHEKGRSGNYTLANRLAFEEEADWVLHLQSDQVFYDTLSRENVEKLIRDKNMEKYRREYQCGYRFWQYEMAYDLEHFSSMLPDDGTNDGALLYQSKEGQSYVGQGASATNVQQFQVSWIQTVHLRVVPPIGIDPYEYYYKRYWYHLYAVNEIMEHEYNRREKKKYDYSEIVKMAKGTAADNFDRYLKFVSSCSKVGFEFPGVAKVGSIDDIRAPKDIPSIFKEGVGIEKYMRNG